MKCKCGHCVRAMRLLKWSEPGLGLCEANSHEVAHALHDATAVVSGINGQTMVMTLETGKNIVRFLVPVGDQPAGGSVGHYSDGEDANIGIALATALAGLKVS